ncbi:MAG: histidine--tRNA ligase [Acidobacteria bacterium]|nr:histidine--tRNA ligase [Acidobacteriota bacterium]MBV9186371.1 histidine--tRNA ligase [Acidobacteriota bacterium]
MTNTVEPRVSRGLRDLLPDQMLARQSMIDTIRRVYELYGFVPLSTPAIEFLDVLSGSAGQEAQSSIFRVTNPENEALGLRFDLTVPLARVIAQYKELPRPFRRYQVSPVWRADKPDKGRFREFTQFDLDSVGTESEVADTEVIAGMCDTLSALNVGRYLVRFSSRAILNLLLDFAGISAEQGVDVFRVLDKLDKVGLDKVSRELMNGYKDESGDTIRGVGLGADQVDRIKRFLDIKSDSRRDVVASVRELFAGLDHAAAQIDVVEKISNHLYNLGYGDDRVSLDLSIARGLAYYTGPVFEAILLDAPQFGSIFGGGRYDGLVMRFLGEPIPAVGASIGVDRLLAALAHLGRVDTRKATARVLVTSMDRAMTDDYLQLTWELRRANIPTEFYIGTAKRLGKQLEYADQYDIPLAILCGSNEKAQGIVTVKNMAAGRAKASMLDDRSKWLAERPGQTTIPRERLVEGIRDLLAEIESPPEG